MTAMGLEPGDVEKSAREGEKVSSSRCLLLLLLLLLTPQGRSARSIKACGPSSHFTCMASAHVRRSGSL